MRGKDITGQKFGRLTALEPTNERYHGSVVWKCQCKCGGEYLGPTLSLLSGRVKSCGCLQQCEDLSGVRFGRLTVIEFVEISKHCTYWRCMCDCGKAKIVAAHSLKAGTAKSCGCFRKESLLKRMDDVLGRVDGTTVTNLRDTIGKGNKSGIRGVYRDEKNEKWVALIGFKGIQYRLGRYDKLEDAAKARKEAEERLWKPFLEEHKKAGGESEG